MKRTTAFLMAVLGTPLAAFAAPPDFSGVWSIVSAPATLKTAEGATPPLSAAGKKLYDEHQKALAKGDRASFDETTICLPPGLPRLMLVNKPFELVQREKVVYFIHQDNRMPRRAYFGEALPKDPDPLYLGFSVARWDGNALVIDSSGFREGTLLDDSGLPHSAGLKLTERYELDKDGKTLHARFTIEDAQMYSKPWNAVATYRALPGYEIPEEVCADSMKTTHPVKRRG